jgi:PleD family two-component response regulator
VTVSIGVAQGPLGATGAARSLVASADRALYAAKHAGRNRVTLAHDAEVIVPVAMPDRRRAG